MKPSDFLERANQLVSGERAQTHGDYKTNHENIAYLWNGWMKAKYRAPFDLTAADVAQMMSLLKKARTLSGSFNRDDIDDDCAYSSIAGALDADK